MKTTCATSIALTLLCLAAVSYAAEPQAEISGADFDFGLVTQNQTYSHQVWLKAIDTDSVEIMSIKTGCGCLTAPLESVWAAPGDSLPIVFYWQTRNSVGKTATSAYLYTGVETRPIEVLLQATVVTDFDSAASISWAPLEVRLPGRTRGEPPNKMVRLTNQTDEHLAVAVIETGRELNLQVPDSLAAGEAFTGFVALGEDTPEADFESSFTLELTGNLGRPIRVSIPVVFGDFSFRPEFTTTKE